MGSGSMEGTERVETLKLITNILLRLGLHANQYGYHYLRTAILMVKEDQERITSVTKLLYPDVAKFYHVSSSKIERAIRTSIETAWKQPKKEIIKIVFKDFDQYMEHRPTNTEFIEAIVEYLNEENTYIENIC